MNDVANNAANDVSNAVANDVSDLANDIAKLEIKSLQNNPPAVEVI